MAKHDLHLHLPKVIVDGRDSSITIKEDGKVLGCITFSKGSIDYYPRNRKKHPISMTWREFDELMQSQEEE